MRQTLEHRLRTLKDELESGQKMMADLEAKQTNLRDTMLRITGAIQVIEELLEQPDEIDDPSIPGNGIDSPIATPNETQV